MSREEEDFLEGERHLKDAIKRLRKSLKENKPAYFDISEYEDIIDYLLDEGELEVANKAAEWAMLVHPSSVEMKIKYAQVLGAEGKILKMLESLIELEKLDKNNIDVKIALSSAYGQIGDFDKAMSYYEQVHDKTGEYDANLAYDLGISLRQAEKYEAAIKLLEVTYQNNKLDSILYELAYCHSKVGNIEKSIEYCQEYLNTDLFNPAIWYNLGINYNYIGDSDKAIDAYDYALALQEDLAEAHFNKGNVLANIGKVEKAIVCYKEYLDINPDSEDGNFYLADCYFELGDNEQACAYYRKAFEINNENIEALHKIAIILIIEEDFESAQNVIVEALKLDGGNDMYWATLGSIYHEVNRLSDAKEAYRKAIELNIENVLAWGALSAIAAIEQSISEGLKVLEHAEKVNPANPYLLSKIILINLQINEMEVAEENMRKGFLENGEDFEDVMLSQIDESDENLKMIKKLIQKYKPNNNQ